MNVNSSKDILAVEELLVIRCASHVGCPFYFPFYSNGLVSEGYFMHFLLYEGSFILFFIAI